MRLCSTCGFVPWLIRWSERHPLNREEGMATNHGITLNTQPWRNTHMQTYNQTHTHRNTHWTIGPPNTCGHTVLHTQMCCCYAEPPAGVQPEQHHTNIINNLQLFMSHIEGEKSQYANWYYFALTQIMFSHAVWKSAVQFTLASGKVSLKYVGSHDSSVKKVLAVHKCVIMTALKNRQNEWHQRSWWTKDTEGALSHFSSSLKKGFKR